MSFKRYKSVFQESKKVNKKLSLNKESILNRFKRVLREEDLNPSDVEDIVGKIEEVITDVIGDHGVDNPVVDELSSTVKAINMQNRMTSDIDMMESRLNNKFLKLKKESMYDMDDMDMDMDDVSMDMDGDMYDEPVESFDTGYDMEVGDEDEFMYDSDSIMEAEEDEDDEEDDEDEDEKMKEAYDDEDEEEDEKEKKESYKRKRKIAEMKKRLREADDDEEDEEEEEDEYGESVIGKVGKVASAIMKDDDKEEMDEEAESDEGDNLIDYDNGSDYDYLSSIDSEGNYSSSRGMDADMDDNG
jgi:hypothetical protein